MSVQCGCREKIGPELVTVYIVGLEITQKGNVWLFTGQRFIVGINTRPQCAPIFVSLDGLHQLFVEPVFEWSQPGLRVLILTQPPSAQVPVYIPVPGGVLEVVRCRQPADLAAVLHTTRSVAWRIKMCAIPVFAGWFRDRYPIAAATNARYRNSTQGFRLSGWEYSRTGTPVAHRSVSERLRRGYRTRAAAILYSTIQFTVYYAHCAYYFVGCGDCDGQTGQQKYTIGYCIALYAESG